jgi:hypothetical protein
MNCTSCKKQMGNVFIKGTLIDKLRFKNQEGFMCVNIKCKLFRKVIK